MRLLYVLWTAGGLLAGASVVPAAEPARADYTKDIAPLVTKYCTGCHGGMKPRASIALDTYHDEAAVLKDRKVWEKVITALQKGEMPPANKPKPSPRESDLLLGYLNLKFTAVDCTKQHDPGRVTIRRLNRAEYDNTIRDLLGVDFHPADDFPADDVGFGFDNIGEVLALPPIMLEKYLAASEKVVEKVWRNSEAKRRVLIARPTGEKDPKDAARKILTEVARRAFRRPVEAREIDRYLRLLDVAEKNGDGFDKGIQLGLQAILVSPHFLFRIEIDKEPNNPDAIHPVTEFELASRLSYFLWSSMPDEELFELAGKGKLRDNLEAQVKRMLKDAKSKALVENFGGQWLNLRNLKVVTPDAGRFSQWNDKLRADMAAETELFFETIVREDHSVLEFLDADYTFVNARLAKLYGLDGVTGEKLQRVKLKDGQRGGIITQASVLTITSNPTRTSPVKRGKWILENILGTPPPPPPPDVPELDNSKDAVLKGTLKQRMEQHRANPSCATCHQRMDALGFGLENFDAIGGWRTKDGTFDVDASGVLPDGQTFSGPAELKKVLLAQKEQFAHCLSEKMLTYGVGRGLDYYDRCAVDSIATALPDKDYKFSALILEVVNSEPFQLRRGKRGTR
jgi:hypothetical protein